MKQRIILFCGHDNSGKTTIAEQLSKEIKIPYFKNPNTNEYFKNKNNIDRLNIEAKLEYEFLKQTKYSLIRDRGYICEYVYSKVYDRKTDYDFIIKLNELYKDLNLYIIYCYKEIIKNFKDEFVKLNDIKKIKHYYFEFLYNYCMSKKTMIIETSDEDLKKQIKNIKGFIK